MIRLSIPNTFSAPVNAALTFTGFSDPTTIEIVSALFES
jgi:hypothetical protein